MIEKPTKEMQPRLVSPQAALDELQREQNVRLRCFPRWVAEGRVSATDAQDRVDRMHTAITMLGAALEQQAAAPGDRLTTAITELGAALEPQETKP